HQYAIGQLPSLLGIALIPGFVAMLLYYRALSSTPASVATLAELAYPATLFLVLSLPTPVGQAVPLHPVEIIGAVVLVAAVTALNLLKQRDVVAEPRPHELRLATEAASVTS
ncbi:MAG: drug/metabolite transporter, family, partial [Gaiellales bacterium]|nr:drug/metabolite transporter, family [Gaiellales bacterium]